MEQRSPEWYAARRGRITASSVGAILGLSPFTKRSGVLRLMVREHHGEESEFEGNIATEYGNQNEAGAGIEYELETGETIIPAGFAMLDDWAGASPDGYIGANGLIEIKCPFGLRKKEKPVFKTLAEQPHYYAQIQFQLLCTRRDWCDFYQWAPGGSRLVRVDRDDEWIAKLMPQILDFRADLATAINSPDEHLAPLRVEVDTVAAHQLVDEYDQLTEAIELAKDRRKEVLAEIVSAAKGRDALVAGRKLTLVKRVGSVSYAKALKALAPDANFEPYRGKPSESWMLT